MEKGYTKASNVNPMQQQNQDQEILQFLQFLQSYSVRFPPHNSKRRIKYIFIYI